MRPNAPDLRCWTGTLSRRRCQRRQHGFSLIELMAVLVVTLVLFAMALPSVMNVVRSYRLSGEARNISGQLALARMRAAAEFTQARLNVNVAANSYQIQMCTTKNAASGGCTTFTAEGGTQYLSSGITFAFGTISTPAGTQTTIAETTPILFNSRGIPIDATSLTPTANSALYLTNGNGQWCAVTVSASGKVTIWQYAGSSWAKV